MILFYQSYKLIAGAGGALSAMASEVSMPSLLEGSMNSMCPRVLELDGCKHLIPRTWICAATERATALAALQESLLDLVKVAQRNDPGCRDIVEKRSGKRTPSGDVIWQKDDAGLVRYRSRIVVPDDPALRDEVMTLHYDDPLAGHFGVSKTLELLLKN